MNKLIILLLATTFINEQTQADIIVGDPNFKVNMPVVYIAIVSGHQETDSRGVTEVRSFSNSDTIFLDTSAGGGYSSLDIQGGYASGSAHWEAFQTHPIWGPNRVLTDIDMGGNFTIPDIYISYRGSAADAPLHVTGSVHTTLNLKSLGTTFFKLQAQMPGYNQNKYIANMQDGVDFSDVISYNNILMAVNSPLYL